MAETPSNHLDLALKIDYEVRKVCVVGENVALHMTYDRGVKLKQTDRTVNLLIMDPNKFCFTLNMLQAKLLK